MIASFADMGGELEFSALGVGGVVVSLAAIMVAVEPPAIGKRNDAILARLIAEVLAQFIVLLHLLVEAKGHVARHIIFLLDQLP